MEKMKNHKIWRRKQKNVWLQEKSRLVRLFTLSHSLRFERSRESNEKVPLPAFGRSINSWKLKPELYHPRNAFTSGVMRLQRGNERPAGHTAKDNRLCWPLFLR